MTIHKRYLFREAARHGHAGAQYNLGQMSEEGRSLAKDDVQAATWVRRAAEQGLVEAQQHLGAMCVRGVKQACPQRN